MDLGLARLHGVAMGMAHSASVRCGWGGVWITVRSLGPLSAEIGTVKLNAETVQDYELRPRASGAS